jgi:hypothetical protein
MQLYAAGPRIGDVGPPGLQDVLGEYRSRCEQGEKEQQRFHQQNLLSKVLGGRKIIIYYSKSQD